MQDTLLTFKPNITTNPKKDEDNICNEVVVVPPPCAVAVGTKNRSHPNSRRVTPTHCSDCDNLQVGTTKLLLNGDRYTGKLSAGVPHGTGKYLWSDGCVYEGEWLNGKASGGGKFSWPSGATYDGYFKSGRMDGTGVFIAVDGDSYKGSWVCDRKQGYGEKCYANGDVYKGLWRNNSQDGEGMYVWSNGNVYVGDWRNGEISGRGVLTWGNGSRYEGFWNNGVPKSKGLFTLSKNENANTSFEARKRSSVDGGRRVRNLPSICIWELDGEAGDITCDIVPNNVEASAFNKDQNNGCGVGAGRVQRSSSKKPGQTISKGHKNYDLILNLQLGIRHSVGKHASILRELRQSDFDPKEKYWTRFPLEGSKSTPPHQSADFKWKDYCPVVFRHLRELFEIDPANYMLAICGSDAHREFSSPGKSGSFFYLTQDDRFMIKTVKKSEVKVLIRMLPTYYRHVCKYKNSLVTKFFGVHCVKPLGGQKTRFVVMGNLFCSEHRIHKRFDLKGSSYGRSTDKSEGEINETTILKDLDLNFVFHLERSWFQELFRQIDRDCEFLEAERIMDYSLLVGVHFRDDFLSNEMASPDKRNMHRDETSMRGYHLLPEMDWIMEGRGALIRLGANMPGRAERVSRIESDQSTRGGSCNSTFSRSGDGEMFDVVLYFGIIDILQDYDISKKLEHAYKSLQVDSTSISAVDPKLYSKRFRDFIRKIFLEDK